MTTAQILLEEASALIREAAHTRPHLLVAIDGRCASGKTTLAAALERELACTVIHMDHFFLRPVQRTPERLRTPGENIDHERFLSEVLRPLRAGDPFAYRPFDCGTQTLAEAVRVEPCSVCVVEGSYACHPALRDYYDLRLFLTVEPAEQMRRIRARNGDQRAEIFRERWIPLEEAYFSFCRVRECCVSLPKTKA